MGKMDKIKHACLYEPDDDIHICLNTSDNHENDGNLLVKKRLNEDLVNELVKEYDNKIVFQDNAVKRDAKLEKLLKNYYYPNDIYIGNGLVKESKKEKKKKAFWLDCVVASLEAAIALFILDTVITDFLNEIEYSIEGIIDVIIILFFSIYSSVRLLMLNDKK